ncbi:MAG: hypothetical protein OXG05_04100 [Gammaproteobacteria bacterium]|nr:hypothetical protein [Gammaproteobacteria bacterium]
MTNDRCARIAYGIRSEFKSGRVGVNETLICKQIDLLRATWMFLNFVSYMIHGSDHGSDWRGNCFDTV